MDGVMVDFFSSPDSEPSTDIRDMLGLKAPEISRRTEIFAEIRRALEEFAAEDVLNILQDPDFRPKIVDTFKMSISPVAQMIEDRLEPLEEGDEWKRGENTEEAASERMDCEIEEYFDNPENLERLAKTHASMRYLSSEEIDQMYQMMVVVLERNGADAALVSRVAEKHAAVMQHTSVQAGIFEKLVDRALREGIDNASTREAEMDATREVFPTADDYRRHVETATSLSEDYNQAIVRALSSADTQNASFIRNLLGSLARGKGIMEMMGCELQKDLMERTIARLYQS
jgi:hypothetical protein